MSELATRLRERRQNVWAEAKGLADKVAEENREFSGEEEQTWQRLNSELDALDSRIKNVIDGEQRAKDVEESFAKLSGRSGGSEQRSGNAAPDTTGDELRAWMRGEKGGRFFEVAPSKRMNIRELTTRALTVGTATAGGDTVPTSFYDQLVQNLIVNAAIMQAGVTVINTAGGETIQIPKTTAHSSAAIVSEGGTIGSGDPAFGQVELNAYKYGTLVQVSRELIDDTGVDLQGYLAMETGRALGNAFGAHAITGTGTSQPRGVITDATAGVTGAAGVGGLPTYENIVDLFYSVIAPYRASQAAHWMCNDLTVAALRKLRTNVGGAGTGEPLWQPSLQVGVPDTLLGKPVLTDPNIPAAAVAAKSILFGDFSRYFVRLAGSVRFERSDEYAFNTDLVTFRCLMRADAALVDLTGAVKYYVGGAAS